MFSSLAVEDRRAQKQDIITKPYRQRKQEELRSDQYQKKEHHHTYRKHHDRLPFAFDHHGQVKPHLEPPKSFMDEDVPDLRRWDELLGCGQDIGG